METIGYIRVSSSSQNLDRQREIVDTFHPARVFEDTFTGKSSRRPGLDELINYCRQGDKIIVPSIDRLGRSLVDLNDILSMITKKGAVVYFVKENIEFTSEKNDPMKTLMFNMLSSFAQFEREILKERQSEGVAVAKKRGKYKGGKPHLEKHKRIIELFNRGVSRKKIATVHKVASYPTVSKVIADYQKARKAEET